MSSTEAINAEIQPNLETPVDLAKKQAKRVFIGFAATITIGLAVAGWYVGGRIFAAEKVHAAAIVQPVSSAPAPAPVSPKPVEPAVAAAPIETPAWNTVEPQSGGLYLQL